MEDEISVTCVATFLWLRFLHFWGIGPMKKNAGNDAIKT